MAASRIPSGYQLHVDSWENDADAPQTNIVSGLTADDVKFYLDLLGKFKSRSSGGLGNGVVKNLANVVKGVLANHPNLSEKVREEFKFEDDKSDPELDDDHAYEMIGEVLGYPANDYGYSGPFIRVFDRYTVYFIKSPINDVTKEFKAKKAKVKKGKQKSKKSALENAPLNSGDDSNG